MWRCWLKDKQDGRKVDLGYYGGATRMGAEEAARKRHAKLFEGLACPTAFEVEVTAEAGTVPERQRVKRPTPGSLPL